MSCSRRWQEYAQLQVELKKIEARLMAWHAPMPTVGVWHSSGVGPIGARAGMKAPDPRAFPSGRHFAAWIG